MLSSLALIVLLAFFLYVLFEKLKLPGILGFILTGLALGPHATNLIHPKMIDFSSEFKQLALIIILVRAGLALQMNEIKNNKFQILSLSFIPLCLESLAIALMAHYLLGLDLLMSLLAGIIVSPVAPAVVIPHMLGLKENENFPNKKIPNILLASTSLDNVWALSLFGLLLAFITQGGGTDLKSFLSIPVSLVNGTLIGLLAGYFLVTFFKKFHIRDTKKVLIILFLCVLIKELSNLIPLASYISIVILSLFILHHYEILAHRLALKFAKIWILAELLLFVLIGANTDMATLQNLGPLAFLILGVGFLVRFSGMFLSLKKSTFTLREKAFAGTSFIPKATIQAALGGIPLSLSLPQGEMILALSTLSILISVPLGAILSSYQEKKLSK